MAAWMGLSEQEAATRLRALGANTLPTEHRQPLWRLVLNLLREPMIALLLACGGLYVVLGEPREAALLLGSIAIVIGITLVQESRTEHALAALRDLASPQAVVIRDGQRHRVDSRAVVPGDLLVLREGDRVAADALVRESQHLHINESLLTGEAVPVRKAATAADVALGEPGGEDLPFVYAGTLVVGGEGIAEVQATGATSTMGRIGSSLANITEEETALHRETRQVVRVLAVTGALVCGGIVLVFGILHHAWLTGILSGLTLAMALIPEEFPVVLTIFFALGAWRIAQCQVLARRMAAIETLGATTVLCTDKTGTLTRNQMTVAQFWTPTHALTLTNDATPFTPDLVAAAAWGAFASPRQPVDPMEQALWRVLDDHPALRGCQHPDWTLLHTYPLTRDLLVFAQVWDDPTTQTRHIAAKGAPEALVPLFHLPAAQVARIEQQVQQMARGGLRVLGIAHTTLPANAVCPTQLAEVPLRFVGLVGFVDPVRPQVPAAVRACTRAGIRVVMITGDYPATAQVIARQAGLVGTRHCLTGKDIAALDDKQLVQAVAGVTVFARMVPDQKLRLVQALKAQGEVVAMTGDGVNDAPALKAAHIGIAMGARGTDVAREAAALVLLDDDFSSIVQAVRLGRQIFDNIRKAMAYVLAIHVPIAGLALVSVLLHWPLALLPIHIVFLELIIDPACSLVFENEPAERDVLTRPPRPASTRIFSRSTVLTSLAQGSLLLALIMGLYDWALAHEPTVGEARALAFTALVVANLGLIFANRSETRPFITSLRDRNGLLWIITGSTLAVLALVLAVPGLRDLFAFGVLHPDDLALSLGVGGITLLSYEAIKWGRTQLL